MAIVDLGHPALGCHDIDATLAFYALLGIDESFRLLHDDGSLMLIYLHLGGDRFLELFPNGPAPDQRADGSQQSFRHICLKVDGLHDFVEDIRAKGVTIDVEPKMGLDHNVQAWITDPDGNRIELMELAAASPQVAIANGTAFPASDILIEKQD